MRILHVNKYYHEHDGASRYMVELMRLQEQAGHTVAPFAMHEHRNFPSIWDKYFVSALDTSRVGGPLQSLQQLSRALWSREAKRQFACLVKAYRPDVVHIHNIYTQISPSILSVCRAHKIPVVMTVHDYALVSANYSLWTSAQGELSPTASFLEVVKTKSVKNSLAATFILEGIYRLHELLGAYDKAIKVYLASSEFIKKTLLAAGYAEDKIKVVPLFAGNLMNANPSRNVAPLTPPKGATTREGVLFAGRLIDYKGVDLVVKAAVKFRSTNFYIAGTGPLSPWVHEQAKQLPNLKVLDFLKSKQLWQKMSEVLLVVVPSKSPEPFGLVAIEAMAMGTPVLVSDAGGLAEKVRVGETGFVFNNGDFEDLARKLTEALGDRQALATMGEKARSYALEQADPKQHLAEIMKIYQGLVYPQ